MFLSYKKLIISHLNLYFILFISCFILAFSGCYSFKGLSIDPSVKTFYVANFDNKAQLAPPALAQEFTEKLRTRVRDEVRLKNEENEPDVEFSGSITGYNITTEAPKPGEGSSTTVLTMTVNVEHINHKNEKSNYKKDFSFAVRFDANTNLSSVQDDLGKRLNKRITDDILNATFNNW
jgi:Lipopolysaccharide-assembly